MKKNNRFFFVRAMLSVLVFLSVFSLFSCREKDEPLALDNSEPLAADPITQWLLVLSPYVACHEDADYSADVKDQLRKGEIRRIEGDALVNVETGYEQWYCVEEGWIPGGAVQVFSNKFQAQSALDALN